MEIAYSEEKRMLLEKGLKMTKLENGVCFY